jgi:ubiquitin C-terminal hydrolase
VRFRADGSKILTKINIPSTIKLPEVTADGTVQEIVYAPYYVGHHVGSSSVTGHYYAEAQNAKGRWFCYNDDTISEIGNCYATKASDSPYLIAFHRIDNDYSETTKDMTNLLDENKYVSA